MASCLFCCLVFFDYVNNNVSSASAMHTDQCFILGQLGAQYMKPVKLGLIAQFQLEIKDLLQVGTTVMYASTQTCTQVFPLQRGLIPSYTCQNLHTSWTQGAFCFSECYKGDNRLRDVTRSIYLRIKSLLRVLSALPRLGLILCT